MSLVEKLKMRTEIGPEIDEEIGTVFEQDPAPGERPTRGRKTGGRAAPATTRKPAGTAKLAREVAEDLATLLEGTAAVWGLQDQCCAPVLEQQAKPIADALVGILSRNPRLLAKFAATDLVSYTLQSVALGKALLPVGRAVYRNHVSKAVDDDAQEGQDNGAIRLADFPTFSGIARPVPA
jgi:hypothetical protein